MDPAVTGSGPEEQILSQSLEPLGCIQGSQPLSAFLLSSEAQEGIGGGEIPIEKVSVHKHEDDADQVPEQALHAGHDGASTSFHCNEGNADSSSVDNVPVAICLEPHAVGGIDVLWDQEEDVATACNETAGVPQASDCVDNIYDEENDPTGNEAPAIAPYTQAAADSSATATVMEQLNSEFEDFEEQMATLERECSSLRINKSCEETHASQTEHHREMFESTGDSVHKAYSELYNAVPMDMVQRMHDAIQEIPQVTRLPLFPGKIESNSCMDASIYVQQIIALEFVQTKKKVSNHAWVGINRFAKTRCSDLIFFVNKKF